VIRRASDVHVSPRSRLHLGDRREDEAHRPHDDDDGTEKHGVTPHSRRPGLGHGSRLQRTASVDGGPSSSGCGDHVRARPETTSGAAFGRETKQFSHQRSPRRKNNLPLSGIFRPSEASASPAEDARAIRAATASTRTTRNATARRRRRVERCMGTDADSSEGRSLPDAGAADVSDNAIRRAREACPRRARCGTPQFSHRARAASKRNREG